MCGNNLLASIARAFDAAFHANIFTLGGIFDPPILGQHGFSLSDLMLEAGKHIGPALLATLAYTDFSLRIFRISLIFKLTHQHHLALMV